MAPEIIDLTDDSNDILDNLKHAASRAQLAAVEAQANGDFIKRRSKTPNQINQTSLSCHQVTSGITKPQHVQPTAFSSNVIPSSLKAGSKAHYLHGATLAPFPLSSQRPSTHLKRTGSPESLCSALDPYKSFQVTSQGLNAIGVKVATSDDGSWASPCSSSSYNNVSNPKSGVRSSQMHAMRASPVTAQIQPQNKHARTDKRQGTDEGHAFNRFKPSASFCTTSSANTKYDLFPIDNDATKLLSKLEAADPLESKDVSICEIRRRPQATDDISHYQSLIADYSSFPPGFDRGRFPKERRRRGGKKYGTPRLNGFPRKFNGAPSSDTQASEFGKIFDGFKGSGNSNMGSLFASRTTSDTSRGGIIPSLPPLLPGTVGNYTFGNCTMQSVSPHSGKEYSSTELLWSDHDHQEIVKFFMSTIAPGIRRLSASKRHLLTTDESSLIDESIAKDVVNVGLLRLLRSNCFVLSTKTRWQIERRFSEIYNTKLKALIEARDRHKSLVRFLKADFPWESVSSSPEASKPYLEDCCRFTHAQADDSFSDECRLPLERARSAKNSRQSQASLPSRTQLPGGTQYSLLDHLRSGVSSMTTNDQNETFESWSGSHTPRFENLAIESRPQSTASGSQILMTLQHSQKLTSTATFQDPYLESIIAQAALSAPQVNATDIPRQVTLTKADQKMLLEQPCLLKSVSRRGDNACYVVNVLHAQIIDPVRRQQRRLPALLRHRELGSHGASQSLAPLQSCVVKRLQPWRHWKGASSDIVSVAWNPASSVYAVGAAAHTNPEDLQYNRPCNLLLGHLHSNKLIELPDHRTRRPAPNEISRGPNSSQETYNACDPMVYQTINSVRFSRDGKYLYTASRDHTVKVWDTSEENEESGNCIQTFNYGSIVTSIDVNFAGVGEIFACASQSIHDSIQVYSHDSHTARKTHSFSSFRAEARPHLRILPECLRWGPAAHSQHLLLCGFTQWDHLGHNEFVREGHLCLWDVRQCEAIKVTPGSQSVTCIAWHPSLPHFVTGGAPGGNMSSAKHSIRSVVRTYDTRSLTRCMVEFETKALEIQDVTYHPVDSNIVTASCTDGIVLVWDYRWPNEQLHCLRHDKPLTELDHGRSRAETDTGVRLSLWNSDGSLFYSGSSDGMVKAWDVRRHPQDVLIQNVSHVGAAIQDGAFSPDFAHMLIGDADGGVHILSAAPTSSIASSDNEDNPWAENIQLVRAFDGSGRRLDSSDDNPGTEGIESAQKLIDSSQLEVHPLFGPGKGRNYSGPYAKDSQRKQEGNSTFGDFDTETTMKQVFYKDGRLNTHIAAQRSAHTEMRRALFEEEDIADLASADRLSYNAHLSKEKVPSQNHASSLESSKDVRLFPSLETRQTMEPVMPTRGQVQVTFQRHDNARMDPREGGSNATAKRTANENPLEEQSHPEEKMMREDFWWPLLGEKEITAALGR